MAQWQNKRRGRALAEPRGRNRSPRCQDPCAADSDRRRGTCLTTVDRTRTRRLQSSHTTDVLVHSHRPYKYRTASCGAIAWTRDLQTLCCVCLAESIRHGLLASQTATLLRFPDSRNWSAPGPFYSLHRCCFTAAGDVWSAKLSPTATATVTTTAAKRQLRAREKQMDGDLLNEVFQVSHRLSNLKQDVQVCETLVAHFCDFVDTIEPVQVEGFAFTEKDVRAVPLNSVEERELAELQRACRILKPDRSALQSRGALWVERWFPSYGCALLTERISVTSMELKLVFPDAWEHCVQQLPDNKFVHNAVPAKYKVLVCGRVKPGEYAKILVDVDGAMRDVICSSMQRGRSTVSPSKTAHSVADLLSTMMKKAKDDAEHVLRRGGITRIEPHAPTCWPLVCGVIVQFLLAAGVLSDKSVLLFMMHLLAQSVQETKDVSATNALVGFALASRLEDAFAALQKVGLQAVDLQRQGYDASAIEERCAELRRKIASCAERETARTSGLAQLPSSDRLKEMAAAANYPSFEAPQYADAFRSDGQRTMDDGRIRQQLELVAFFNVRECSETELLEWIAYMQTLPGTSNCMIVALRTIETFMFSKAKLLHSDCTATEMKSAHVREILRSYELFTDKWSAFANNDAVFDVEQQSRGLLVKWIAFCLAHKNAVHQFSRAAAYRIPLRWTDLHVAVLRERVAVDALSTVAAYIRKWNRKCSGGALFDLCNQAPTIQFALSFALDTKEYIQQYDAWVATLKEDIEFKWRQIEVKKAQAVVIRKEISTLQLELLNENQELAKVENSIFYNRQQYLCCIALNTLKANCNSKIWNLKQSIANAERNLATVLMVPGFYVSPLPECRERALEVLFFMNMPKDIVLLGEIGCIAQSSLVATNEAGSKERVPAMPWWSHYNRFATANTYAESAIVACPQALSVPRTYGPSSVDELFYEENYARRCVWYPPGESTQLFWRGRQGDGENPFKITQDQMIRHYTHRLPHSTFQWAIAYPGGETRANLVYSKVLETFDGDFDKQSFIAFGLLRAYPNQQIRKLCCALKDNVLPWSHPCVGSVIRQAVFQVGELTHTEVPTSLWKTDIAESEGLATLCAAIGRAAEQLSPSPRNFQDVPILSEVAAFVLQWAPEVEAAVAKFVAMCGRWAEAVKKQYQQNRHLSMDEVTELRALECLLYGYALQSRTLGECDGAALYEIAELVVLFRNSMFYSSESSRWKELQRLEIAISETLSRRIGEVVQHITDRGSQSIVARIARRISEADDKNRMFTALLKLVNTSVPANLKWVELEPHQDLCYSSCFATRDRASGTHYSLNLFTGVILTDGNPPGGLPAEIRTSTRFRELFGERDFEVVLSKDVYTTARAIEGCYFHFKRGTSSFHLREVYLDSSSRVRASFILCDAEWVQQIADANALPKRVLAMHSLWYWIEKTCVIARPPSAFAKDVTFALMFATAGASATCFQVPFLDQRLSHRGLMRRIAGYDSAVQVDRELLRVLRRFEDVAHIQAYRTPAGRLKITFPRFGLTFMQVDDGENGLLSCELSGYALDPKQQFGDVFPHFDQYLLLRLDESVVSKPLVRIIVPLATVSRNGAGHLRVNVCGDPAANLQFAVFDMHRRLGTLSADSLTSRLLLCVLLASTGSVTPSRTLAMTGTEAALRLLEACYSSQPVSELDVQLLRSLRLFGHREPALQVLACCILERSGLCCFTSADQATANRVDCVNALTAYRAMCAQSPERNVLRCRLRKAEERLYVGHVQQPERFKQSPGLSTLGPVSPPVEPDFVGGIEAKLLGLLVHGTKSTTSPPPLPVKQLCQSKMGAEMNIELAESWRVFHKHQDARLTRSTADLVPKFRQWGRKVARARTQTHEFILKCVDATRCDVSSRLLALINYLPTPTTADIVMSAFDDAVLSALIPRTTQPGMTAFKAAPPQSGRSHRASALPDATAERDTTVHESEPLGEHDTAAELRRVPVSPQRRAESGARWLDAGEAKQCGKFMMVAPEYRMSLELKLLELQQQPEEADGTRPVAEILEKVLDPKHYIDVLDECDAVLDHKYHLVYAVGYAKALECGVSRWTAVETLIQAVTRRKTPATTAILKRFDVCFERAEYAGRLGGFSGLRLNPAAENKAQVRDELHQAIAFGLVSDPPASLWWMSIVVTNYGGDSQDRLIRALTDATTDLDDVLGDMKGSVGQHRDQLLALRGLLAFGVFEHCLEKRYRVDFGLPDAGTRPKRVAIPFRAADIPSERSEFSHPEVNIAFTLFAYYHNGLTKSELREALEQLMKLSLSDQEDQYAQWYSAVKDGIPDEDARDFPRDACQLSPRNTQQFAMLHKVYQYSMEAVSFFLNTCVFPSDTTQYPHRLCRS
ncbi:hypothetical protein PybrP1_011331, partial [[Pythium] brassicae (nom. inval.)]